MSARWRLENKEKLAANYKKWRSENRSQYNEYRKELREKWHKEGKYASKKYGINPTQFLILEQSQGGQCAICQNPQTGRFKRLVIDHCHRTGRVRGLLCSRCNLAIGSMKDDSELLLRAVRYLTDSAKQSPDNTHNEGGQ